MWNLIKVNFTCEEWLFRKLPEYTGDQNDLDAIAEWIQTTQEREQERLRKNAELAQWLFSNPVNLKAVQDGIRAVWGSGKPDELIGSVFQWVCDHGERLMDSPATSSWAGRLYGLSRELALDWSRNISGS